MIRLAYRLLLRLQPPEWRDEMLAVFDAARSDARGRSRWEYLLFAGREVAGMLRMPTYQPGLVHAMFGIALGLAAAWTYTTLRPEMFTSTAQVRTVPGLVQPFVQSPPIDLPAHIQSWRVNVLSRPVLVNIAKTFDLYPAEMSRLPLEDIVEIMRRNIAIEQRDDRHVEVAFRHHDPHKAQRVTRDLMMRLMDQHLQERNSSANLTVEFLRSETDRAAAAWEDLEARLKPGASARLQLDLQLARKRYERVREMAMESETIKHLVDRKQGPTLEVVEFPSLPAPSASRNARIYLAGAAAGLVASLLMGIRRIRRLPEPPDPIPVHG